MQQRSVETQESIETEGARAALRESNMVESDETLGWKISFID